jgi:hypothetical protein
MAEEQVFLTERHCRDLSRFLNATNWQRFGRALPEPILELNDLENIRHNHPVIEDTCFHVLHTWCTRQEQPLLRGVLHAAENVRLGDMCREIRGMLGE